MSVFADPPNTTAEEIAVWLTENGWFIFTSPALTVPEQIAVALEGLDYHDFADPSAATAEEIALLINADSATPAEAAGPTDALRAWRAW